MVIPLANTELQILGIKNVTRFGPTTHIIDGVGVYHREIDQMQNVFFDLKIETVHSNLPMLFSLILAVPITFRRKIKALVKGVLLLYFIDSLDLTLLMTWVYLFLQDFQKFSPFSNSALRDSIVNFFYYFYALIGNSVIVLIIWASLCLRKADFQKYFHSVRLNNEHSDKITAND